MKHPVLFELVVYMGAHVSTHTLPSAGSLRIGRDEGNDLQIDSPSVSRRHAILHVGPPFRIEDLGSRSGTFVHSAAHEGAASASAGETHEPRRLVRQAADVAVGDCVSFGSVQAVIRRVRSPSDPVPPEASARPVARDKAMAHLYELAGRAAEGRIPVLILGETGAGKEVLADWIHARSRRAQRPLVKLNCAAIPSGLLEGELFGTEKGVFNDAPQRPGLLETADGGTVFLDEVGELPLPVQVKLLRVLEDGKVTRLGGRAPRALDLRFLAATNRDLGAAVRQGTFREDLFFRLNGMTLVIPPLRKRVAEIEPLAEGFAERACAELERARVPAISRAAIELLERYAWPGNVRELRNVLERAVLLCGHGESILPEHLPPELLRAAPGSQADREAVKARGDRQLLPPSGGGTGAGSIDPLNELEARRREIERRRILDALEKCGHNQTKAAELLGIARRTMTYKMNELRIDGPRARRKGRGEGEEPEG